MPPTTSASAVSGPQTEYGVFGVDDGWRRCLSGDGFDNSAIQTPHAAFASYTSRGADVLAVRFSGGAAATLQRPPRPPRLRRVDDRRVQCHASTWHGSGGTRRGASRGSLVRGRTLSRLLFLLRRHLLAGLDPVERCHGSLPRHGGFLVAGRAGVAARHVDLLPTPCAAGPRFRLGSALGDSRLDGAGLAAARLATPQRHGRRSRTWFGHVPCRQRLRVPPDHLRLDSPADAAAARSEPPSLPHSPP